MASREDSDVRSFATVVDPFRPPVVIPEDRSELTPTIVEFTSTVVHRRFTATLVDKQARKGNGKPYVPAGLAPVGVPAPQSVKKSGRITLACLGVLLAVGVYAFAVLGRDTAIGAVSDRSVILVKTVEVVPYPFPGTEALVVVPLAALLGGDGHRGYVFVLGKDSAHVQKVPVNIEAIDGGDVVINASLIAGWRVVTDGAPLLKDGSSVRLPDASTASL